MSKLYAEACERNRAPILDVLREIFAERGSVLEIGSGTGQHAAAFAAALPHLCWQPTDVPANLPSIEAWRADAVAPNLMPARVLDLSDPSWPIAQADYVVCINTIHIVGWPLVEALFSGVQRVLRPGGVLYLYGPFRYRTRALEPSNERFDAWLKRRDPRSGVRVFEDVDVLATEAGLRCEVDRAMPANNRSIWWRKI
jgi:SAM-dependent methyltransferase